MRQLESYHLWSYYPIGHCLDLDLWRLQWLNWQNSWKMVRIGRGKCSLIRELGLGKLLHWRLLLGFLLGNGVLGEYGIFGPLLLYEMPSTQAAA